MIGGSVTGLDGVDRLIRGVQELQNPDLTSMTQALRQIVVDGHRRMVDAGVDRFGKPLVPLAESTLRKPGQSSRPLSSLADRIQVEPRPKGRQLELRISYPSRGAQFAKTGTIHEPRRDIFGLSDQTEGEVRAEVERFGQKLIEGAILIRGF